MNNPYITIICDLFEQLSREQNNNLIKTPIDKKIWQALCHYYVRNQQSVNFFFFHSSELLKKTDLIIADYYAKKNIPDDYFFSYFNENFNINCNKKFKQLITDFLTLFPKYIRHLRVDIRQALTVTPYIPFQESQISVMILRKIQLLNTSYSSMREAVHLLFALPFIFIAPHQEALLQVLLSTLSHPQVDIRLFAMQALYILAPQCLETTRITAILILIKDLAYLNSPRLLACFIRHCNAQHQQQFINQLTVQLEGDNSALQKLCVDTLYLIDPSLLDQQKKNNALALIQQAAHQTNTYMITIDLLSEHSCKKIINTLTLSLSDQQKDIRDNAQYALEIMTPLLNNRDKVIVSANLLAQLELYNDCFIKQSILLSLCFLTNHLHYLSKKNVITILLDMIENQLVQFNKVLTTAIMTLIITMTLTEKRNITEVLIESFHKENIYSKWAITQVIISCSLPLNDSQVHAIIQQILTPLTSKYVYIQSINMNILQLFDSRFNTEQKKLFYNILMEYGDKIHSVIRSIHTKYLSDQINHDSPQPLLIKALIDRLQDSNMHIKNPVLHKLATVYTTLNDKQQAMVLNHLITETMNPAWDFKEDSIRALLAITPSLNSEDLERVINTLWQKNQDSRRSVQCAALSALTTIIAKTDNTIPQSIIALAIKNATHPDWAMAITAMEAMSSLFIQLSEHHQTAIIDVLVTRLIYPCEDIRNSAKKNLLNCLLALPLKRQIDMYIHVLPKMLNVLNQKTKIYVKIAIAEVINGLLNNLTENQKDYFSYNYLLKNFLQKKVSAQQDTELAILLIIFHQRAQHFSLKSTLQDCTDIADDPINLIVRYLGP